MASTSWLRYDVNPATPRGIAGRTTGELAIDQLAAAANQLK